MHMCLPYYNLHWRAGMGTPIIDSLLLYDAVATHIEPHAPELLCSVDASSRSFARWLVTTASCSSRLTSLLLRAGHSSLLSYFKCDEGNIWPACKQR